MKNSIPTAIRNLLLGLIVFTCAPAESRELSSDQYTVIPAFQIDLERNRIFLPIADRVVARPLTDCSNKSIFCLDSSELKMVWKRQCGLQGQVGDFVAANEIAGRVVGFYDRLIHHSGLTQREFIFMVEGQGQFAYIVNSRAEVRSFLIDNSKEGRLTSYFGNHKVFELSALGSPELEGVLFSDIFSRSNLGGCS